MIGIKEKFNLKTFNTLSIDSIAEYFVQVSDIEDLDESMCYAKERNIPIKVLGGGSNVIMSPSIQGLVLQYTNSDLSIELETESVVRVKVGAGYNWHQFVMCCLEKNWYGLENLALIPGTVGAAPIQNIGAYGVEVKEFLVSVEAVNLETGSRIRFSRDDCKFDYRDSIFKQELDGKYLIISVVFDLRKTPCVKIGYGPLRVRSEREGLPTPKKLADWVVEIRRSKIPDPQSMPNAGSFFKNPVISIDQFKLLEHQFPSMPYYQQDNGVKIPAGWLIEHLGLKGVSFGRVLVHDQQALVLINKGGSAVDIANACREIKSQVEEIYGIQLEQEPRILS